jgi:hypothetical protein
VRRRPIRHLVAKCQPASERDCTGVADAERRSDRDASSDTHRSSRDRASD